MKNIESILLKQAKEILELQNENYTYDNFIDDIQQLQLRKQFKDNEFGYLIQDLDKELRLLYQNR